MYVNNSYCLCSIQIMTLCNYCVYIRVSVECFYITEGPLEASQSREQPSSLQSSSLHGRHLVQSPLLRVPLPPVQSPPLQAPHLHRNHLGLLFSPLHCRHLSTCSSPFHCGYLDLLFSSIAGNSAFWAQIRRGIHLDVVRRLFTL